MDLLYFLNARIRFVFQLYDSCVAPYVERKRQIEAHEPPFVDMRHPDDYDGEPAFLAERQDADNSIMVIGHWCLCMLQAALHAYLNEFVSPRGANLLNSQRMLTELNARRASSYFETYRRFFIEYLGIDWNDGPVTLSALEQLNLTRNDLQHNLGIFTVNVERAPRHAERFPEGLFTDGLWATAILERIHIDRLKLRLAAHLVTQFCRWIDGFRCSHPDHWPNIYNVLAVDVPAEDW